MTELEPLVKTLEEANIITSTHDLTARSLSAYES